ncbi:MAG: hypothetical protein CL605_10065, partial [Altibacter sp.]|uniref:hypothetical protein n=1 Tax=Altibacter sp. TaxID=2024823 RepID=UPI000C9354DF|nr:hypothetical protein [Altibacter sp.]
TYSVGDGGLTQNNFTDALKSKLEGVDDNANNYSLPLSDATTRGGVKIGYTENGKNYPVELDSEQMFVNVPWVDTNTTYSVGDGGLTQKNFTTALKDKLDGITANADVTPTWVPSSDPSYATQSYVGTQISNLVDSAPSTLDTLNELAAALGDDANFSTTVTNSIATKLPLSGGTLTGVLTIPDGASNAPSLRFASHNSGLFATSGKLRFSVDGASRGYIGSAGIFSGGNVYTADTSEFRNYGGTWKATTGLTGNGFQFINSVDGTAMTLSSAGNLDVGNNITLGGTVDGRDVATDGSKLDGIAANANNYSLPAGSSSTRGGFKIGYTENGQNYPVEVSSEQMFVNVPWVDTNTTYSVGDGGLTENNFTDTLKSKLDGIANNANNYSLPLATSSTRGGVKVGYTENGKNYPVELSSEQMFVNVPWVDTNTTYSVGDGGLTQKNFTTTLKNKLDGITANADVTPSWVPSSNPNYLTSSSIAAPLAPASVNVSVVGETIDISFTQSSTSSVDEYLVYSSVDGSDFGLISVISPDDFSSTMSVIDNSFTETGTQAYRVYAKKLGNVSSAATSSTSYTVSSAEPTNMSVVPMNCAFHIQWNPPSSNARFVTAYKVFKHEHASQGSLSRSSATEVYSGMNTNFVYQISGNNNNNYHQFWVETTIA